MKYTSEQLREQEDYLKVLKNAYNPNLDILKNDARNNPAYGATKINLRAIFNGISTREFKNEIKEIRGLEWDLRADFKNWKTEIMKHAKIANHLIEYEIKNYSWGKQFLSCYFSILYSKINKGEIKHNDIIFKEEFLSNYLMAVYEELGKNGNSSADLKLFTLGIRAAGLTRFNSITLKQNIVTKNKKSGKLQYVKTEGIDIIKEGTFNRLIDPLEPKNKDFETLNKMIIDKVGYVAYDELLTATRDNKANQRDNKKANNTKNKIKRNIKIWLKEANLSSDY